MAKKPEKIKQLTPEQEVFLCTFLDELADQDWKGNGNDLIKELRIAVNSFNSRLDIINNPAKYFGKAKK